MANGKWEIAFLPCIYDLMLEMTDPGKNHRNIVLICGVDNLRIAHRAPRLNHGSDPISRSCDDTIGKREKCI